MCSLCSAASRQRDTHKEQESQLLPHQCYRQDLHSEQEGGWSPEDICVCSLSFSHVGMLIVTFRQKVSSNSSRTHSELSWREINQYERQIRLATDGHICQCCLHPQGDINNQTQVSFPKIWEGTPGQMRASLGQWKEDIGLLMCNEAEPKNLLKMKEKQPGQWGASDAALNLLDTTAGAKYVQDPDVTGTPLAEYQLSFAVQPNPKPQITELLPAQGQQKHLTYLWICGF